MLISHLLIGTPASGKSTFAKELAQTIPNSIIISSDATRAELFGDGSIQGNWELVEEKILEKIEIAIAQNCPVIYDATNAKRCWRMSLLAKLKQFKTEWVTWHIQTPVDICKQWNSQRDRQVPDFVIENMDRDLKAFPPIRAEGFLAIQKIVYQNDRLITKDAIEKFLSQDLVKNQKQSQNRTSSYVWHRYSRLLDFDRLMHLISLILNYPGIGNLQETSPQTAIALFGKTIDFKDELDEICAFMKRLKGENYSDREAIAVDLAWLETNGIIGECDFLDRKLEDVDLEFTEETVNLIAHPYSDLVTFDRLTKLIRYIIHASVFPIDCDLKEYTKKQLFTNKKKLQTKLKYRHSYNLQMLVFMMLQEGVLKPTEKFLNKSFDDLDKEDAIEIVIKYYELIRNDLGEILKPYQLLSQQAMKKGYFIGNSIFSTSELTTIFQEWLEPQAKHIKDLDKLAKYENLKQRVQQSQLIDLDRIYPIRKIGTMAIVNHQALPKDPYLAYQKLDKLEDAIVRGELLHFGRRSGTGRYAGDENDFCAYPLQIVFHNIAWYLGYEQVGGDKDKLLRFERLDRLFLKSKSETIRDEKEQKQALKKLEHLYACSAGIHLGYSSEAQHQFLSSDRAKKAAVQVTVKLLFSPEVFKFISEGTQRFPRNQMKMTPPMNFYSLDEKIFCLGKSKNPKFPYQFQVTLLQWSLDDVDLKRWILGFDGEVKVIEPKELVDRFRQASKAMYEIYRED
jgi:predicted kinase